MLFDAMVHEVFVNVTFLILSLLAIDIIVIILDKVLDNILDITKLTNSFKKTDSIIKKQKIGGM